MRTVLVDGREIAVNKLMEYIKSVRQEKTLNEEHFATWVLAVLSEALDKQQEELEAIRLTASTLLAATAIPAIKLARLDLVSHWRHLSKEQIDNDPTIRTLDAGLQTILLNLKKLEPEGRKTEARAAVTSDERVSNPPGGHTFAEITVTTGTFFKDEAVEVRRGSKICGTFDIAVLVAAENPRNETDSLSGAGSIVLEEILLRAGDTLIQRGIRKE
jgi:hypothetical protein